MTRFLATPRLARRLLAPLLPAVLVAFLALLCALGGTPASAAPASPPLDDPPTYVWPLAPPHPVVRPFEPPPGPYEPGHRGVDLGGAPDEPVYSAGDGIVVYAGTLAGRTVVSIKHDGDLRTTYEPIKAGVTVGQPVRRGDVIGHLQPGHPECSATACLHWGARRGDEYLDPLGLLSPQGHVRLLPWAADS